MSGEFIAFFILSMLIFAGAVFMLNLQRIVHMIFAMAFTFLSIAGIYVMLQAEFVAVVQIIVYTGSVSILAVFGIMMTKHQKNEEAEKPRKAYKVFILILVAAFLGTMLWIITDTAWPESGIDFDGKTNAAEIGKAVFTDYVIPFELVSVLLLVALVGAIVMAKEEDQEK